MSLENLVIQNNTVLGYNGKNANIVIPEGVTEIGEGAFKNCSFAKVVTIESSVLRTIGNNAFEGCTALEQIKLNSLRGAIGDKAFYNCSKLESIEIPHGAMEIGSKAFGGCAELSLVCIPSSVMVIKADAFDANASRRLLFICDDKTDAKKYAEKCGIPNKNKHGLSILRNALAESKKKRENLGAKTFSLFGQKIYAPNSLGLKVSIVQHYNGEKDAFYRNIYSKVPQKLTDEFAVKDIATIAETFARNTQNRLADQGVFTTIERISLCVEQPADKLIDFMTALGNVRQSLLGIGNSQLSDIKNDLTAQAEDKVTGLSYGIIGDSLSLALHAIDDYRERQRQRAAAYAEAERKYNVATAQVSEVLERNYKDIINKHVKNNLRQVTEAYIDALCDTEIRLLWEHGLLAEISESDYSEEKSTEILEKANGCDPEYTIGLALKTYPINLSALILAGQQNLATDELVDYIQFMNIKDETTVRCILQSANVSWKRVIEYWNENEKAKVCEDAISARVDKITQRIEALANGIVEKATAADYQTQIEKLITADQWEFACKVKPVINHKLNKKLNFTQAIANTGEGFLELGSRIADYNSRYTNADVFATNTVNADMSFKDKILALAPYKDILEERKLNDLLKNDIMAFFGNILSQQLPEYDGNNPNKIEEAIRGLYVKALGKDTLSIMGDMGLIVSIPELGQKSHEQEYRAFEWVKVLTRLHIKEEQQRYAEELKEKLIPAGTFAKAFMIAKEYAYKLNPADCVYLMKEHVCKVNAILKKLPETIAIPENTPEKEIIHLTQKAIYEIMNDDCWAVYFCADAAYSKDCEDIQRCMRQLVETTNDTVLHHMWYTLGCGLLQKARNIRDVKRAKELLKKAGTYRDSRKRLKECDQKEAFFIKKTKKIVISLSVATFSAVVAFVILLFTVIMPTIKYNKAIALMDAGNYEEAIMAFKALSGYKDSENRINACKYNEALILMNAGKYTEAISGFEALNGYKDSANKVSECNIAILNDKYNDAVKLMNLGKHSEAIVIFEALGGHKDSVEQCYRAIATLLTTAEYGATIHFASIDWVVLDKCGNSVLLISKKIVEHDEYKDGWSYDNLEWINSDICEELNEDFAEDLKDYMQHLDVLDCGNKISLLTVDEFYKYSQYIPIVDEEWWLRDTVLWPNDTRHSGKKYCANYVLGVEVKEVHVDRWLGVRPVIRVNLP